MTRAWWLAAALLALTFGIAEAPGREYMSRLRVITPEEHFARLPRWERISQFCSEARWFQGGCL